MSLHEYPFFDQVGLMSVGHARLSLTFSSKLVFEPQLDQKKIPTPSFLHCSAQSGSRGPFPLNLSARPRSFTLVHTHSFAHIQKRHFSSAQHLISTPSANGTSQIDAVFCIAGLQHIPKGHNWCFGACGSEPNGHSAGAICYCDR